MRNRIPFARGLGSSAATIAAGVAAGLAWQGSDADPLPAAAALEGHPDNVAAALLGGVTLAWNARGGARALRLGALPGRASWPSSRRDELATERARAALPAQVGHADAVHTAARAALLVAALEQGRTDALADALDDRLHEPYRAAARAASSRPCASGSRACRRSGPRSRAPARRCSSGVSRARRSAVAGGARRPGRAARCRWPSPTAGVTVELTAVLGSYGLRRTSGPRRPRAA